MSEPERVPVEYAHGCYRMMNLAEALLSGAVKAGWKRWPSGVRERVYRFPVTKRTKEDDGSRGLGNGRVVLTERERVSLERYIGEPVRDAQDARKKMKAKGLRFTEKGEELDETCEAHIDYAMSGGEKRGEALPEKYGFQGWDRYGIMPSPKPFDFEGRLRYHRERLGERTE